MLEGPSPDFTPLPARAEQGRLSVVVSTPGLGPLVLLQQLRLLPARGSRLVKGQLSSHQQVPACPHPWPGTQEAAVMETCKIAGSRDPRLPGRDQKSTWAPITDPTKSL